MDTVAEYLKCGAAELEIDINENQLVKFSLFADELCKWNRKINLTAITNVKDIVAKHFLDSMVLVKKQNISGKLLDIGSGGGFPAIPLKIVSPDTEIVSVDAVEKKIHFQKHIARLLQFEKFDALHARAENLPADYSEKFSRVVSRAFSDIPKFVSLALPLLAADGIIIAMKGKEGRVEASACNDVIAALGGFVAEVQEFRLPLIDEARSLVIIKRRNV